jgi:hypothetical protein
MWRQENPPDEFGLRLPERECPRILRFVRNRLSPTRASEKKDQGEESRESHGRLLEALNKLRFIRVILDIRNLFGVKIMLSCRGYRAHQIPRVSAVVVFPVYGGIKEKVTKFVSQRGVPSVSQLVVAAKVASITANDNA